MKTKFQIKDWVFWTCDEAVFSSSILNDGVWEITTTATAASGLVKYGLKLVSNNGILVSGVFESQIRKLTDVECDTYEVTTSV